MGTAPCPECTYEITLPKAREGQRIACPNCGAELEVISSWPLELDWAYSEPENDLDTSDLDDEWAEDWDGDEEEDEDWEKT